MRAGDGDTDRNSGPKSFLNHSNLLGSDGFSLTFWTGSATFRPHSNSNRQLPGAVRLPGASENQDFRLRRE